MLMTSNGAMTIIESDTPPEDPSGAGRKRHVSLRKLWPGMMSGYIGWGEQADKDNSKNVHISTTNARIQLHI